MGLCSRCGTETGGAKFCPECGLPQSLQGGVPSAAEPGAFVPLTIGKKSKKANKVKGSSAAKQVQKAKAAPASAPRRPAPAASGAAASPSVPNPPAQRGSSAGRAVLVVALCLVCGLAITFAVIAVATYLNESGQGPSTEYAVAGSLADQAQTSSLSATARESSRTKMASSDEKAALQAVIAEAAALAETDYTIESYAALAEAIEAGRTTSSDEAALSKDVRTATKRIESAKASLKEKVKPIAFNGTGSSVMDIPPEMTSCIVAASHPGEGRFSVSVLGEDGGVIDALADVTGPYAGTTAIGRQGTAPKRLSIVADGEWAVTLQAMADAPYVSNGQQVTGDAVVRIDPQRAAFLSFTNAGAGSFVVYGIKGSSFSLVVNEIGPYAGSIPNSGYRMLAVRSNGTWSVSW